MTVCQDREQRRDAMKHLADDVTAEQMQPMIGCSYALECGGRHEQRHAAAQRLQRSKHGHVRGAARLKHVQQRILYGVHVAGGRRHEEIAQRVAHISVVRLLKDSAHNGHQHAGSVTGVHSDITVRALWREVWRYWRAGDGAQAELL
jgi:hypothetical protein